jgi:DNA polymerase III alpha subunit
MLWNEDGTWRHSKFNRRALEALVAIRAFDSLECVGFDRTFESYKQMYEILINRNNDIKKWTKKNPVAGMEAFKSALIETVGTGEWTRRELVENSIKYLSSFNPASLVPDYVLEKFEQKKIKPIDEVEASDIYWFVVMAAKQKQTKNGKPYLLLETSGPTGQTKRIFCWGWDGKKELPVYSVCIAEVTVDSFGCKTFMSKVKVLDEEN